VLASWLSAKTAGAGILSVSITSFGDARNFWRARISLTPPADIFPSLSTPQIYLRIYPWAYSWIYPRVYPWIYYWTYPRAYPWTRWDSNCFRCGPGETTHA